MCDAGTSPSGHRASGYGSHSLGQQRALCSAGTGDKFGFRSPRAFHSAARPMAEVPVLCVGAHVQVLGSLLIIL